MNNLVIIVNIKTPGLLKRVVLGSCWNTVNFRLLTPGLMQLRKGFNEGLTTGEGDISGRAYNRKERFFTYLKHCIAVSIRNMSL